MPTIRPAQSAAVKVGRGGKARVIARPSLGGLKVIQTTVPALGETQGTDLLAHYRLLST